MILDMEKNMLEGLGDRVLAANRSKEALRLAKRHAGEIDLLITDVIMPEILAWLATRLVRLLSRHPPAIHVRLHRR